jgi:hypothetical protein
VQSITLQTWNDIHSLGRRHWLWRGHRRADWEIKTSIECYFDRWSVEPQKRASVEGELLRDFTRKYHEWGARIPALAHTLEWLSIMQHHGAPTRLADFSYSTYIAAYFALERAEGDCAIWGIDGEWAARASIQALADAGKRSPERFAGTTQEEEQEAAAADGLFSEPHVRCAIPLNPFRMNARLRIQMGIFIVPGDPARSFMDNLRALSGFDAPDRIVRVIIPAAMKREAIRSLFYMNVSRTSLFPGLDGYARSLGVYHPALDPGTYWAER